MLSKLREIFTDICRGYSVAEFNGKKVYFKHLTVLDRSFVEKEYNKALNKNLEMGLRSREEWLEDVKRDGTWSTDKEVILNNAIRMHDRLRESIKKAKNPDAAATNTEGLKQYEKTIEDLTNEREDLLRQSAESYAMEESLEYQLYNFSFSDESLTTNFFQAAEFEYLRVESILQYYSFRNLFVDSANSIDSKSLRLLCIQHFFQDLFSVFESSPYYFFGKSAHQLTEFQVLLLRLGKYFGDIIDMCDSVVLKNRDDPSLLESYAIIKNNARNQD